MEDPFVIIGGDAAGMSAAGKAKRDAPERDVVVLEREAWASYGACGLPYYVKGEIASLDDLVVMQPEKIIEERGIDLRRRQEAVRIDAERRSVTVKNDNGQYELPYGDLLIATGGRPVMPDVTGVDLEGVFGIRSLRAGRALKRYVVAADRLDQIDLTNPEAQAMRSHFDEADPETVAVVGANKIGLEFAEAFVESGRRVHVFEAGERVLPTFGADVSEMVEDHLRESGVELHFGTELVEFESRDGRVDGVETADGTVPVDAVVVDVGVDPETAIAEAAGVELGPTGAIATDEYGRTNVPHVYAAGDCAEKRNLLTGDVVRWPFGLAANRAGRAVGRTVAGRPTPVGGVVGTMVMKVLDLQVAQTGIVDEDRAREAGFEPVSALITSITRAHYYPGWSRMVVHALADADTGRLLGANLVAEEGTAHRINAVAAAITAGMTVTEVGQLDFGYAPPFGPVWDPVLGVAKVLDETLAGDEPT